MQRHEYVSRSDASRCDSRSAATKSSLLIVHRSTEFQCSDVFIAATRLFQRVAAMNVFAPQRIYALRREDTRIAAMVSKNHRCDSQVQLQCFYCFIFLILRTFVTNVRKTTKYERAVDTARSYVRILLVHVCNMCTRVPSIFLFFFRFFSLRTLKGSQRKISFLLKKSADWASRGRNPRDLPLATKRLPPQPQKSPAIVLFACLFSFGSSLFPTRNNLSKLD